MTDQEARYDRIAEGYTARWSPVHRPATLALLDEIAPAVAAGATRILDVGCGTGAFAGAAAARWPEVRVTGIDASAGMITVAERELAGLAPDARTRVTLAQATADRLPFEDAAFDVVTSAFVLQLVPSRFQALREARRVLAAGGTVAFVTWLAGGSLPADEAYDNALVAAGLEPLDAGGGGDELRTPAAAAAQLRRAGFGRVEAREDELDHRYTPEDYLAFIAEFDDEDLFESLEPAARAALEADLLARLRVLPPDGLLLRLPIVYATGRRSDRG